MDDSASVDLVDVSPIGSPDHFRITIKQLWRAEEAHSDAENEDTGNVADGYPNHRRGSPQRLPPSRGSRRLKPFAVDTGTPPPSLSPGYPLPAESSPSPSSYTSDYFDFRTESLLQPTKVEDDMWLRGSPRLLVYDPDDFGEARAWDLHSRYPAFQDSDGDESDSSEPSEGSTNYITFTGRSASMPSELELGFWQLDPSESSPLILDFPEDVGESLDHDALLVHGDSLGAISCLRRPPPAPEITAEVSAQAHDSSQTPSICASGILIPRIRRPSGDSGGDEPALPLSHPKSDMTGVPLNVPVSPFVTDDFPDDSAHPRSDLAGDEAGGISIDADWLGLLGEIVYGPSLEEELTMEWDRWRGQLVEELDRDLNSWAEVRESVRAELDRV